MSFFQLVLLLVQLHVHKTQVLKLMNMNLYMGNMCIFLFNFATQNFLREMMAHPFPRHSVRHLCSGGFLHIYTIGENMGQDIFVKMVALFSGGLG